MLAISETLSHLNHLFTPMSMKLNQCAFWEAV